MLCPMSLLKSVHDQGTTIIPGSSCLIPSNFELGNWSSRSSEKDADRKQASAACGFWPYCISSIRGRSYSWSYAEKFCLSLPSSRSQLILFLRNKGHFGSHVEFLKTLQMDYPGILLCQALLYSYFWSQSRKFKLLSRTLLTKSFSHSLPIGGHFLRQNGITFGGVTSGPRGVPNGQNPACRTNHALRQQ